MKKDDLVYKEYCVGCGLCESCGVTKLVEKDTGYMFPEQIDSKWMMQICPCSSKNYEQLDKTNIWGKYLVRYSGWSTDDQIRIKASSGGVLTALAIYLIESKQVDGIIHVCKSKEDPTQTEICISTSRDELIERCGSRYSISHPLQELKSLDVSKKYAFIGKPCDVAVLKNYEKIDSSIRSVVPVKLSFFCAGLPSKAAQMKLLNELKCNKKCVDLNYRGNGWPGDVYATDEVGNEYRLDYETAWGKILGRDIMKMCRLCPDGVGEMADISCGDYWYLNEYNKPDFSEHEGRNVIFVRTQIGKQILEDAEKRKYIMAQEDVKDTDLYNCQKYQYIRKSTMISKVLALKICRKQSPFFNLKQSIHYAKKSSLKVLIRTFLGTVKRACKGVF